MMRYYHEEIAKISGFQWFVESGLWHLDETRNVCVIDFKYDILC